MNGIGADSDDDEKGAHCLGYNNRDISRFVQDVTLQSDAIAAGNGSEITVGGAETATLEISGTSTSRTILFECQSVGGAWYPIQGVRLSDLSMATQTTGKDEVWQFDITGLAAFRARITAIAGGNISVKGRVVG